MFTVWTEHYGNGNLVYDLYADKPEGAGPNGVRASVKEEQQSLVGARHAVPLFISGEVRQW